MVTYVGERAERPKSLHLQRRIWRICEEGGVLHVCSDRNWRKAVQSF
jgi:hypothetical protein